MSNMVEMIKIDGTVSEIHCEGFVCRPDHDGVVSVPATVALTLIAAGFIWVLPRNPAQTN